MFTNADWSTLLIPQVPLLELLARGTLVYLGLFLLLRCTLKREIGAIAIADLLTLFLVAEAVQNALAPQYRSIPEGLILVGVIVFWNVLIDWLAFRFPRVERWISPPPLLLVRNGVVLRRNLRQEMMTEEELLSHLRQQGIEHIADVKKAFMEPDGRVSVVANTAAAQQHRPEKTAPAGR